MLGCTHYPLLISKITKYLPDNIQLVSQGSIVATSLADYLKRHPEIDEKCTHKGDIRYLTTESIEKFTASASIFLNEEIVAEHIDLD